MCPLVGAEIVLVQTLELGGGEIPERAHRVPQNFGRLLGSDPVDTAGRYLYAELAEQFRRRRIGVRRCRIREYVAVHHCEQRDFVPIPLHFDGNSMGDQPAERPPKQVVWPVRLYGADFLGVADCKVFDRWRLGWGFCERRRLQAEDGPIRVQVLREPAIAPGQSDRRVDAEERVLGSSGADR